MNRINKPSATFALLIAGALALAGCNAAAPGAEPPLAGAAIGGDFALTASDGRTVQWGDFAGKYRVVYFGYAFCPDICPTDMQRVAQGLKVLKASDPAKAAKIQPIFITIDPERDTPEVLKAYMANFGPDFVALRPTPEQLPKVTKDFKIYYKKVEGKTPTSYTMDHSAGSFTFDPQGRIRLYNRHASGAEALAADVKILLSGK